MTTQYNSNPNDKNAQDQTTKSEIDWNDPTLANPDGAKPNDKTTDSKQSEINVSAEIQIQLAASIVQDIEMCGYASKVLDAKHLTDKGHKACVKIAYDCLERYGQMPDKAMLVNEVKQRFNEDKAKPYYVATVSTLLEFNISAPKEYLKDQIRHFQYAMALKDAVAGLVDGFSKAELGSLAPVDAKFRQQVDKLNLSDKAFELKRPSKLDDLTEDAWLIAEHLTKNSLACVFGPSGDGKSFVCLDMALSIATGTKYLGQYETIQSRVVYICAEGQRGIKARINAWASKHPDCDIDLNLLVLDCSINLSDKSLVDEVIKQATEQMGGMDILFIDTLSRNFTSGGDTDNNDDMILYLACCDYIRKQTGATVLNIHHTGHANPDRERGAKALRDYSDHTFGVLQNKATKVVTITGKKQKDIPVNEPYDVSLVPCGKSAVLEWVGQKSEIVKEQKVSAHGDLMDRLLRFLPDVPIDGEVTEANGKTSKQLAEVMGVQYSTARKKLNELVSLPNSPILKATSSKTNGPDLFYQTKALQG